MVYEYLPIVLFVIELGLIGYYIFSALKNQKFISKSTIFYFVPISVVLFSLYLLGASYKAEQTNTSITLIDFMMICKSVVSATVFDVKTEYVSMLMEESLMYELSFVLAVILSLACVYTSVIALVINSVINKFRLMCALSKNVDVLIGENDNNYLYASSSKNVVVITDNLNSKNINEYYLKKIPYIQTKFTSKILLKYFKWLVRTNKEVNFISFEDSNTNLGYIKEFEDFLYMEVKNGVRVVDKKSTYLKVEIDFNNQLSLKNKILENKEISAFIDLFNRYELFALDFVEKNPITENLPSSYINEELGIIENDKNINVIYLGFGKLPKMLHRVQLMNDQLVTLKEGKVSRYPISYYAFDKNNQASEDKTMNFFFRRYDENISKYSSEEYLPALDKLDNLVFDPVNVESYKLINKLLEVINLKDKKNTFNRFIISYGDDIDDIDMALKLESILKEHDFTNYEIFVRVTKEVPTSIKLLDNERIHVIGDLKSVFNHEVIVNERLLELAKLVNRKYNQKRLSSSSWYSLTSIKQASNIFSSLNIRLKLNLLGYDYVKEDGIVDNTEILKEIESKVEFNKESYNDYLFYLNSNIKPVHVIAYQEHLRWNAFYISNGYVPLKKDKIKLLDIDKDGNPSFYKDDNSLNLHACLTSYEGLNDYHNLLAKLLSESNKMSIEDNLDKVETYKYDHMIVENIRPMFTNSNYRLIKRR